MQKANHHSSRIHITCKKQTSITPVKAHSLDRSEIKQEYSDDTFRKKYKTSLIGRLCKKRSTGQQKKKINKSIRESIQGSSQDPRTRDRITIREEGRLVLKG